MKLLLIIFILCLFTIYIWYMILLPKQMDIRDVAWRYRQITNVTVPFSFPILNNGTCEIYTLDEQGDIEKTKTLDISNGEYYNMFTNTVSRRDDQLLQNFSIDHDANVISNSLFTFNFPPDYIILDANFPFKIQKRASCKEVKNVGLKLPTSRYEVYSYYRIEKTQNDSIFNNAYFECVGIGQKELFVCEEGTLFSESAQGCVPISTIINNN